MTKRKILLVSYYFPPLGGVGTFRAMKLCRHFPDLGWDTQVLTPHPSQYYCVDHSLLDQIPAATKVHRTESLDPFRIYRKLKGEPRVERGTPEAQDSTRSDPFFGRITRFGKALNTWLFVPDNKIGWYPFGARAGIRIVKEEKIDLVYTINVPQTCHLIGRAIGRATGIPWVADFRDAWTANPDLEPPTPIHKSITSAQERSVLREAAAVIAVNDTIRDILRKAGGGDPNKYVTIHNGYEPGDFESHVPIDLDRFTMVFVGTFHRRTDPALLFGPYAEALSAGEIPRGKTEIVVVGAQTARAMETVRRLKIESEVRFTGFLSHPESLRWMSSADLLLQLIASGPGSDQIVSGKLYEYMGAGRPVLTIGPPGEARSLVERLRVGWSADVTSPRSVRKALVQAWSEHDGGGIPFDPDRNGVAFLSFPRQTELLAERLSGIVPLSD